MLPKVMLIPHWTQYEVALCFNLEYITFSRPSLSNLLSTEYLKPSGKCVSRGQMISNHVEYFTWFDMIIEMRVSFYKNQII